MPSMCTVEVGEATLALAICGAGDTVMLLPAGNYSITYLAAFAQRLAEAWFRAVAVNWRGIGASTGPLEGRTLHRQLGGKIWRAVLSERAASSWSPGVIFP